MARRPWIDFSELKQKVGIPDVLAVLGLLDEFKQRGETTFLGVCPIPGHQHGPLPNATQFRIDRKEGVWVWHCFGDCQAGGDVIELVKRLEGLDDAHARLWFAKHFGDRLSARRPREQRADTKGADGTGDDLGQLNHCQAPSAHSKTTDSVSDTPPAANSPTLKPLTWRYELDPSCPYLLEERCLSPETIAYFGIGLVRSRRRGRPAYLDGYVGIPVHGADQTDEDPPLAYLGRLAGRDWSEERPRYKFPRDFPSDHVLYNLHRALRDSRSDQTLVVCEGPFDCFHVYQEAGLANIVAAFGSNLSPQQSDLLIRAGRNKVVLLFDGDEAGLAGMRQAAAQLIRHVAVRVAALPDGKQPDDLTGERLRELLVDCY